MNPAAVRSKAVGALCFLGAADLLFLNLWVFPRAFGPQRRAEIAGPSLSVARAPSPAIAPAAKAAAPAPVSLPPTPVPKPGSNVVAIKRAYFAPSRWVPGEAGAQTIAAVVALARQQPGRWIFVDGHADPTGPAHFNEWLSTQRATAVAERLIAAGVDRARVVVRHFGANRPVAGDLRRNRRVELLIVEGADDPAAPGTGQGGPG